jgi:hypothetical protein
MNANDLTLSPVDTLGELLARIAELTAQADAIKDSIKDKGSLNLLDKKIVKGKEIQFVEGALFSATYIESNRKTTDWKAIAEIYNIPDEVIIENTTVSAVFSVKVTSR